MAPSRFASLRGRSSPRHIPSLSADDAALQLTPQPHLPLALVALRYEETAQAEPPIPIPPPRNPLRTSRASLPSKAASVASAASSTLSAPAKQQHRHTLQPQPHVTVSSPSKPSQHSTAALPPLPPLRCDTYRHSPSPSTSTAYTDVDCRRDSALGSITLSSPASSTLLEDYASSFHQASSTVKSGVKESPPSLYSADSEPDRLACDRQPASRIRSRSVHNEHELHYPCESRWSFSDAGDSDGRSFTKEASSTRRLIRGLSVRFVPPMRRSKKQSPGDAAATAAVAAINAAALNLPATDPPPTPPPPTPKATAPAPAPQARDQAQVAQAQTQARLSRESHQQSTDTMTLALGTPPLQPPLSLKSPDPVALEIGCNDVQSPQSSTNPRPLSDAPARTPTLSSGIAPSISTDIPLGCLLNDDDLDNINFSNRGSVYFGGIRAISAPSGLPERVPAPMDRFLAPRAAPAAPIHRTNNGTTESKSAKNDGKPGWRRHVKKTSLPDIRVMSEDTKRESQKVRSLYESGDLVRWEDGAPGRQSGELLEPPVEAPSEGNGGNIARCRIVPTKENRNSVRAMYLSPTSPLSVTSLPSPRGSMHRDEYELAGGIEDWEDIQGADVDRYGFIMVPSGRPGSRASVPAETRSLYTSNGRRNGRNVLTKRTKGPPLSQGLARIPSRKVSARSLNTQASGYSIQSRRSVRSSIRMAANMLPYNRDRRIIDAAVAMLSLPPGLADVEEEQKSPQAIKAAQDREARRTEKWRNMAKLVTHGKDNKGDKFATNDVGKIVMKMTKKKAASDTARLEIDGVEVEFDTKNPKLIERTWKGIPDRWRSSAWYSFLATSARNADCQVSDRQLIAHFHTLQGVSSPDDVQIDLDVPRTINRHIMFRKRYRGGQRLLFRVLHALSLYFPDVGYVQGMAPLAASLLCYYDEERCFVMLVWLWQFRGLERLYEHGFGGLMIALQDLEKHWLTGKPILQKLNELGIDPTAYGTRWYLTLFNLAIPFPIQLRVWDVFMLLGGSPSPAEPNKRKDKRKEQVEAPDADPVFDGLDIIHATAAALIDVHKDVIMSGDFENVMKGLTSFQNVKDEDKFIELVRAEWNMHRGKKKG